jgi:hypothetical protein
MLALRRPPSLAGAGARPVLHLLRSSSTSTSNSTPAPPPPPQPTTATAAQWEERRKRRLVADLRDGLASAHRRAAASRRPPPAAGTPASPLPSLSDATEARLAEGLDALENLLPGWRIDLDAGGVRAADLAALALDPSAAAARVLALKVLWPRADLAAIVQKKPAVLLDDVPALKANAAQVRQLLRTSADADDLVSKIPELLSPRMCLGILITVNKWYFGRQDPVAVLEKDPGLIERASAADMPLEPVFVSADGSLEGPSLDYWNKRTDWQAYIDTNVYKQPRGKGDVFPSERIVGDDAGGDAFFVGQGF